MEHKQEFLLLASYCGDDKGDKCTDKKPCSQCLSMCNVVTVPENTKLTHVRELGDVCIEQD